MERINGGRKSKGVSVTVESKKVLEVTLAKHSKMLFISHSIIYGVVRQSTVTPKWIASAPCESSAESQSRSASLPVPLTTSNDSTTTPPSGRARVSELRVSKAQLRIASLCQASFQAS
jgi:hypothetical protein